MKTIRNILIILMVGICLIACSSDDTERELANSEIAAPTVQGKRLVKVKHGETFTSLEYNSAGQISKVKYHSKDGTTREDSYWYEDNRIVWNWNEIDAEYRMKEGHVVECNYTALTSMDEDAMSVDVEHLYIYDDGGHLIKHTWPYDFTEEGPIEEIYTYTWKDGNIISVLVSDTSEDTIPREEYDIKYTSIENNIPFFFTYFYSYDVYLEWQSCFGKRCKKLPQSVTYMNLTMEPPWEWGVHSITHIFNYILEDGLVTKIAVESIDDKGNSSLDVYELEWW